MEHSQESNPGVVNLETRIFPLFELTKKVGDECTPVIYHGTCFLTRLARWPVFVTAKHLLKESPDERDLYIGYHAPVQGASAIKVESIGANHVREDISFFIPTPAMWKTCKSLLDPIEPLRHPLPVGQQVMVYGFPGSGTVDVSGNVPLVDVHRVKHKGKVLGVEHDCPEPTMTTVYLLDIPSPRGLSGSPVIVVHNDAPAIAGYVIGEKETDGKLVATAADHTALMEIEQVLMDARRDTASNGD